jgi:ketosteroid isomerase-like protein
MSEENVALIRSLYPAEGTEMVALVGDIDSARREYGPLMHPDFEALIDPQQTGIPGVEGGTRAGGFDEFVRGWQDWLVAFESYRVVPKEFIALADGRVLVLVENRAKSKTGGVEMAFGGGAIWTIEEGLIRRLEMFVDTERALEAAGLSE